MFVRRQSHIQCPKRNVDGEGTNAARESEVDYWFFGGICFENVQRNSVPVQPDYRSVNSDVNWDAK